MFVGFDESELDSYFVLGAVISDTEEIVNGVVRKFRHCIRKSCLPKKIKDKINQDPKETFLYRTEPDWLVKYMSLISNDFTKKSNPPRKNLSLTARYYKKAKDEDFNRFRLLNVYYELFIDICNELAQNYTPDTSFDLLFDKFIYAEDVKWALNQKIPSILNLRSLETQHGDRRMALLPADIVAGTVRRHLAKNNPDFYHCISSCFMEPIKQVNVPLDAQWVVRT